MRAFVVWHNLVYPDGQCSWCLHDSILTVRTLLGSKATQIGGSNPEGLARILAREINSENQPGQID
jgi:hypothetical protein